MITTDGNDIRRTDPYRRKYASAMAEYLDGLAAYGAHDRTGGNVEAPTGWFNLFGKRILRGDDQGFVWVDDYDTAELASAAYDELEAAWCAWEGDDDES